MKNALIIFSTVDGHTKRICEYIADKIKSNYNIELLSVDNTEKVNLLSYQLIIIGASIRYGKHQPSVYNFIKNNADKMNSTNNAFFSVSAVARKPGKDSPDTNPYMIKFLNQINWKPQRLAVFSGKIDYKNYDFLNKQIIRFIMWVTKGPTNTSKVYEFTDWAAVDKFSDSLSDK